MPGPGVCESLGNRAILHAKALSYLHAIRGGVKKLTADRLAISRQTIGGQLFHPPSIQRQLGSSEPYSKVVLFIPGDSSNSVGKFVAFSPQKVVLVALNHMNLPACASPGDHAIC